MSAVTAMESEDGVFATPPSWTAYHAAQKRDQSPNIPTTNSALPIIDHVSHSRDLQFHIMNIAQDYTAYLNPGQITVGCADQPLYALKKQIQWLCPERFKDYYFCFLGGLHIEHTALLCIGQLLKGTVLETIITSASLDTIGLANAVCDVNDIKKARYTLQVTATCLIQFSSKKFC